MQALIPSYHLPCPGSQVPSSRLVEEGLLEGRSQCRPGEPVSKLTGAEVRMSTTTKLASLCILINWRVMDQSQCATPCAGLISVCPGIAVKGGLWKFEGECQKPKNTLAQRDHFTIVSRRKRLEVRNIGLVRILVSRGRSIFANVERFFEVRRSCRIKPLLPQTRVAYVVRASGGIRLGASRSYRAFCGKKRERASFWIPMAKSRAFG